MELLELMGETEDFFYQTKIKKSISKLSVYDEKCVVIDFIHKDIKFAIDITITANGDYLSEILPRKNLTKLECLDKKSLVADSTNLNITLSESYIAAANVIDEINSIKPFDVSIIIPVYNRESLILGCIESINNQSFDKSRFEVIFVDDNSSDNTVSTIHCKINKSINYKIVERKVSSGSASAPRNEGMKIAKGEFIFFMDSDDKIDQQLIEDGYNYAVKHKSDVVYFKISADEGIGAPSRPFKKGDVSEADISSDHLMRSLAVYKLFRRELLIDNGIKFDPAIPVAEDKIFMCQVHSFAEKVSILANKSYYHRCRHYEESEDGHLSRRGISVLDKYKVLSMGLIAILFTKKSETEKSKLFNAWLIICIEQVKSSLVKNNIELIDKKHLFDSLHKLFVVSRELYNEKRIYNDQKALSKIFMDGDFEQFMSSIN